MRLTCPRCHTTYVDPSPAAAVEPRDCPWCGHITSAAPATPDPEGYEKALAAAKTLGPPPQVTFHESGGGIAVMLGDEPAGWLTRAQFEELRRKAKAP